MAAPTSANHSWRPGRLITYASTDHRKVLCYSCINKAREKPLYSLAQFPKSASLSSEPTFAYFLCTLEFRIPEVYIMSSPSPINAPRHILQLLSELHAKSIEQERAISKTGKVSSSLVIGDLEDHHSPGKSADEFDKLMLDKFIALDEDKCQFTYQLINAMGATNVVEAGTSFGVSTIYLALAVGKTKAATGKSGTVIATEKETRKAEVARKYWAQCGAAVEQEIDLRVGNLLETLKDGLPQVDLLLLDSKFFILYYDRE